MREELNAFLSSYKIMRLVGIIAVLVFFSFGFNKYKTKVKITSKSEVVIKGKSNINSFECKYNPNYIEDEISVILTQNNSTTVFEGATILIKSKGFDCGHKMITRDLKTTLKANDYSYISISLKELVTNKFDMTAKINVEIAGVKKEYSIPVVFNQKNLNVKGLLKINIKDFNLKSPKKVLGFVEVKDVVDINFDLFLEY